MSAVITNDKHATEQLYPWYRYGWPWFLISIPMVSIALGMVMLHLAFNANNSLVVDDYYKEGKAYNLRIERDRLASLLGLNVVLSQSSEGLLLELKQQQLADLPPSLMADSLAAQDHFALPETLLVRWVHVTQQERDGAAQMTFIGGNRYIAQGIALPSQGKFRLHVEPGVLAEGNHDSTGLPESDWRLISALSGFSAAQAVVINAPAPAKVFTNDMLK